MSYNNARHLREAKKLLTLSSFLCVFGKVCDGSLLYSSVHISIVLKPTGLSKAEKGTYYLKYVSYTFYEHKSFYPLKLRIQCYSIVLTPNIRQTIARLKKNSHKTNGVMKTPWIRTGGHLWWIRIPAAASRCDFGQLRLQAHGAGCRDALHRSARLVTPGVQNGRKKVLVVIGWSEGHLEIVLSLRIN